VSVVGVECPDDVVAQLVLDGEGEVHVAETKLTVRHLTAGGGGGGGMGGGGGEWVGMR